MAHITDVGRYWNAELLLVRCSTEQPHYMPSNTQQYSEPRHYTYSEKRTFSFMLDGIWYGAWKAMNFQNIPWVRHFTVQEVWPCFTFAFLWEVSRYTSGRSDDVEWRCFVRNKDRTVNGLGRATISIGWCQKHVLEGRSIYWLRRKC